MAKAKAFRLFLVFFRAEVIVKKTRNSRKALALAMDKLLLNIPKVKLGQVQVGSNIAQNHSSSP